jgi:hypothetical protein
VLPSGVNKATGLCAALDELGLSRHNAVAIGDAENDHALLQTCECGVVVSNALQPLKDKADLVTKGDHGRGVAELIDHMLADDLAAVVALERRRILVGHEGDREICIDPYAANILVCGTSGSGKSTFTQAVLERLSRASYQFAIIDPEGDFTTFESANVLGGPQREPLLDEIIDVMRDPHDNVVVNLLGVALDHRPEFFMKLLHAFSELRVRTGRPHWVVVDEAHHLMPSTWAPVEGVPLRPHGTIYLTVHPGSVAKQILETIDTVVVLGSDPDETIREFCEGAGCTKPKRCGKDKLATGTALFWEVGSKRAPIIRTEQPKNERTRHSRKYTEGNLGHSRSFYFRGRDGKLNLKAHNLILFLQMGDGVDDETWMFHLQNGDVAHWLRAEVKDPALADEVEAIAKSPRAPVETRAAVRAAIEKRYTLPADKPSGVIDTPPAFAQVR